MWIITIYIQYNTQLFYHCYHIIRIKQTRLLYYFNCLLGACFIQVHTTTTFNACYVHGLFEGLFDLVLFDLFVFYFKQIRYRIYLQLICFLFYFIIYYILYSIFNSWMLHLSDIYFMYPLKHQVLTFHYATRSAVLLLLYQNVSVICKKRLN